MSKYRQAKKYLRFIVPVLIIMGAIAVPKVDHSHNETLGLSVKKHDSSALHVSQSGQQMYTNVAAANLQPAAPPEFSATSASLSPQQASPNYCAPSEQPQIDGCIVQN